MLPPLPEDPYAIFQDTGSDENAGWVALTAIFPDLDGDENPDTPDRVYLVDYNDPTIYRRISPAADHNFCRPTFFPDRSRVLYHDRNKGTTHNSAFMLYDPAVDSSSYLPVKNWFGPDIFDGNNPVVFTPDQQGFYSAMFTSALGYDIRYYSFIEQMWSELAFGFGYTFVIGMIGTDTLIVHSDNTTSTKDLPGYYFMDPAGNYLARINNPHMDASLKHDMLNGYLTWQDTWNEEQRLLAVTKIGTGGGYARQRHIYVTNLDGTYYHQFTSGPYSDQVPVWGPGGGILLFIRADVGKTARDGPNPYRIMKMDLRTGEISLFVEPSTIDSAIELLFPHY